MTYLLITEPARGTSVRVDMAPNEDVDATLIRWLGDNDVDVQEWRNGGEEAGTSCSFQEWYEAATNDRVEEIYETRHVTADEQPVLADKAGIKAPSTSEEG
jgi:hypothetical protein